jgi:maltooligosyltrehalose trehalohydrolase
MPVAQFPGTRNWGYDGVFPYAAQSSYGGAGGLRRLVDACHERGMSVVLDVVYNHVGPEGNVLAHYGPYFTDRYRTPWGDALNFDDRGSDEVRNYFVENAVSWVSDFMIDALRLDAVHAIADPSAYPFVEELIDAVHACAAREGRYIWVIAEGAANDARLVTPKDRGGSDCDAQWSDDFHHALHTLLTNEREEYYADYGRVEDLATAYRDAFVYAGGTRSRATIASAGPRRACRANASSCSPRTTTRSETVRSGIG